MTNSFIKKFNPEKEKENIIVEVYFLSPKKEKHFCVGVLVKESVESIEIGFNAKNDEVTDFINIKYQDIIDIRKIEESEILKIG